MRGHDAAFLARAGLLAISLPALLACGSPGTPPAHDGRERAADARESGGTPAHTAASERAREEGRPPGQPPGDDRRPAPEPPDRRIEERRAFRDRHAVLAVPARGRPRYLDGFVDAAFGTRLTRIGGDTGTPIGRFAGRWGADVRHAYSKQQPWSSDGRLIVIQNRDGGTPAQVFLDGATFEPRFGACAGSPLYDYRWHPSRRHARELINVDRSGTELTWFDVTACRVTRRWTLPVKVDYGIGSGEGNPSNDGRFVALGNDEAMFVVDMDPQPPHAPYPNRRIGPLYHFPPCSVEAGAPARICGVDHLSISPSGRYVAVNVPSRADSSRDAYRIYDVDPGTLALRPRAMSAKSARCGSFAARPNGWIMPLKHADMAPDPFDRNEDVMIGGRSCPGSTTGRVIKVRLRDGHVTALTDPRNESPVMHVSTRNLDRPGWAYVTYYRRPGKRFHDEVVAVRMDGSGEVERIAHLRSSPSGCYRCEPHAVPSRDGRHVMFASTWTEDCGGDCGQPKDVKGYVVTMPVAGAGDGRAAGGR